MPWFASFMSEIEHDYTVIELGPDEVRRVRKPPRNLFRFYLLPLSLAGLIVTLFAYGWPLPVAGCAVLVGIAIGVLIQHRL